MKKILIAGYIVGAVVTFGHAWNRDYSKTYEKQGTAIVAAPVCAALWPLYWSTVAWER